MTVTCVVLSNDSESSTIIFVTLSLTMTSYLRSWLYGATSEVEPAPPLVPTIQEISPPVSDSEDGDATETEQDDDMPPAFPSLNSAQRVQSSGIPRTLTDSQLMPPPPIPSLARQRGIPNTRGNSLVVPPTTTKPPPKPSKKGKKVALAPGHSPLDWAALKSSGADLRVGRSQRYLIFTLVNEAIRALIPCCVYPLLC